MKTKKHVIKKVHPELLAYYLREINDIPRMPVQIPMIYDFEINEGDTLCIQGTYAYDSNYYWGDIENYQNKSKFEWEQIPSLNLKVLSIGYQDSINCMDFKFEKIIQTLMTEKYYNEFDFIEVGVDYNTK